MPDRPILKRITAWLRPRGEPATTIPRFEQEHDRAGREVFRREYDAEGRELRTRSSAYDDEGNLTMEVVMEAATGAEMRITYENTYRDGALAETVKRWPGGREIRTVFGQDEQGNRTETVFENGQYGMTRVYDSDGRLAQTLENSGAVREEYRYDGRGGLVEHLQHFKGEGSMSIRYENHYDADGRLLRIDMNGRLQRELRYADDGRLLEETITEPRGVVVQEYAYWD